MKRSLLALFRGRDGRSLAFALALLLGLNAFASGMQGVAPLTAPGGVLCSTEDAGSGKVPMPAGHGEPCCLAGLHSPSVAIAGGSPAPLAPSRLVSLFVLLPAALVRLAPSRPVDHGPRGPPSLA